MHIYVQPTTFLLKPLNYNVQLSQSHQCILKGAKLKRIPTQKQCEVVKVCKKFRTNIMKPGVEF